MASPQSGRGALAPPGSSRNRTRQIPLSRARQHPAAHSAQSCRSTATATGAWMLKTASPPPSAGSRLPHTTLASSFSASSRASGAIGSPSSAPSMLTASSSSTGPESDSSTPPANAPPNSTRTVDSCDSSTAGGGSTGEANRKASFSSVSAVTSARPASAAAVMEHLAAEHLPDGVADRLGGEGFVDEAHAEALQPLDARLAALGRDDDRRDPLQLAARLH